MALTCLRTLLPSSRNIFQPLASRLDFLYTSTVNHAEKSFDETNRGNWLRYNEKIYEPQKPDEEPRPAVRQIWYKTIFYAHVYS